MKKIIFIFLILIAHKSNAQHYDIPVQELTAGDTTFYKHPSALHVDFVKLNSTFDSCLYKVITEYIQESLTSGIISKRTTTETIIVLPLATAKGAFNSDGTYNNTVMNAILAGFKLTLKTQ